MKTKQDYKIVNPIDRGIRTMFIRENHLITQDDDFDLKKILKRDIEPGTTLNETDLQKLKDKNLPTTAFVIKVTEDK